MGVKEDLESRFDFDIVDEFMDHYEATCDMLEPIILSLENPEMYERDINELFRVAHNLKSASGFLRLGLLHRLAGFMENTLEKARAQKGPASEEFIDWLLLISDQLNAWLKNLKDDSDEFIPFDRKILYVPENLEN
ncbi:MAG: Hpt domain-containing protein [Campylobacterales bacterium]|nr:Hpt domain-containing protein [Campylobacterales bacterium]